MAKKPTYEELEQKVKEFKITSLSLNRMKAALKESEDKYRNLVNLTLTLHKTSFKNALECFEMCVRSFFLDRCVFNHT